MGLIKGWVCLSCLPGHFTGIWSLQLSWLLWLPAKLEAGAASDPAVRPNLHF